MQPEVCKHTLTHSRQDIISGDELLSDTYKVQEDGLLLTCDCRKFLKKKNEDFELEGANPSAEEGGDGGGDEAVMVHDIEDQFQMNWLKTEEGMKPPKEAFKGHLKSACLCFYCQACTDHPSLHEEGPPEDGGEGRVRR